MCDREMGDLAAMFNPILRGWQQYYGRFHGSAMSVIWKHMNDYLVRWMMRKYKSLARHKRGRDTPSGGLRVNSRRPLCIGEWDVFLRLDDGSRMSREAQVRFCERLGVKLPRPTHPYIRTAQGWLYLADRAGPVLTKGGRLVHGAHHASRPGHVALTMALQQRASAGAGPAFGPGGARADSTGRRNNRLLNRFQVFVQASAGVFQPSVFRGLVFSALATAWIS